MFTAQNTVNDSHINIIIIITTIIIQFICIAPYIQVWRDQNVAQSKSLISLWYFLFQYDE